MRGRKQVCARHFDRHAKCVNRSSQHVVIVRGRASGGRLSETTQFKESHSPHYERQPLWIAEAAPAETPGPRPSAHYVTAHRPCFNNAVDSSTQECLSL